MITESANRKVWCLPLLDDRRVQQLADDLNVSQAVASVYLVRGLETADQVRQFCGLEFTKLHDPYLLPDMEPAVERLLMAIRHNERIMVVGDGDCDGVCSTALAVYALEAIGADVGWHVPSRLTDGFGLLSQTVETAHAAGGTLLLSVDCGTEAFAAAECAMSLGVDLIITDHHEPQSDGAIPDCVACINPKRRSSLYPFPHLAGVGVVFKLILALCERLELDLHEVFEQLVEFVAIGTCADVVSMTDENRVMVDAGCNVMASTNNSGLRELLRSAKIKRVDSQSCGFSIAPMLNAACRLGQPELAVRLLLETSAEDARSLASTLKDMNSERKALQAELLEHIEESSEGASDTDIQFHHGGNWHRGLIGLVAGNLASAYSQPSFVCSVSDDGTVYGSCRSAGSMNLIDALDFASDLLERYGGHAQAAGFELHRDNLQSLSHRLNHYMSHMQCVEEFSNRLEIDALLPLDQVSSATLAELDKLAPFGNGNPQPRFYTPGLIVAHSACFCGGKHLALTFANSEGNKISAIGWNLGHLAQQLPAGIVVDAVYSLELDSCRAIPSMRLRIEDIEASY